MQKRKKRVKEQRIEGDSHYVTNQLHAKFQKLILLLIIIRKRAYFKTVDNLKKTLWKIVSNKHCFNCNWNFLTQEPPIFENLLKTEVLILHNSYSETTNMPHGFPPKCLLLSRRVLRIVIDIKPIRHLFTPLLG